MSENPQNTPPSGASNTESSSAGTQNTEHMIPKSRFDEVNTKYQQLAAELEQFKSEQQKQREQELSEQNRFKELYESSQHELEQLKSVKDQAARYQEALKATNQARIERIPEDKRSLIPEYDDPTALAAWLDKNTQLLTESSKSPPRLDGGAGSVGSSQGSPSKLTDQERMLAQAAGITEEDYAKRKAARGQPLDLSQHGRSPT